METTPITKRYTKEYHSFLRDSLTSGGSQPAKTPLPDTVSYKILGYYIETKFTNEHQCKLTITGKLELEELVSVPYSESPKGPKPEWKKFHEGIFTLIREKTT